MEAIMNVIVLAAALFSSPSFANAIVEDQVRCEAMLAVAMNMALDFDCDPKPSIIANSRIGLLSSRDSKFRAAGVQFVSFYLWLKKQTEGADTFDGTSLMMRKSFGEYLEAVKGGLQKNLEHEDPKTRGIAAASLLALDPHHKKAGAAFLVYFETLDKLESKEIERHELAFLLSFVPPEIAIPTLKRMLACEKEHIRRAALQAVLLIGDEAKELSPAIAKMLVKKDPAIFGDLPVIRIGFPVNENLALLCLGILDTRAVKAVPVLLQAIKTGNAPDEPEVYHLLGKISGESKEVANCLKEAIKSSSEETKLYAATGLIYADSKNSEAMKLILDALESKDSTTQKLAMKACARIGPRAEPAVPTLVKMFKETKDEERLQEFADIFGLIGPGAAEAVPDLKRELQAEHSNGTICENFARAMARIGGNGQTALRELLEQRQHVKEIGIYIGAHEASHVLGDLTEKPTTKTVKALENYLSYDDAMKDCFTLITIGKLGSQAKDAIPTLKQVAKSGKKYRADLHGLSEEIEPYARWALRRVSEKVPKPNPFINKLAAIIIGRTKPVQTEFLHAN
jgi:HEAT repeat protein